LINSPARSRLRDLQTYQSSGNWSKRLPHSPRHALFGRDAIWNRDEMNAGELRSQMLQLTLSCGRTVAVTLEDPAGCHIEPCCGGRHVHVRQHRNRNGLRCEPKAP
jgi:hypothetical protein